jgi:DNA gyrase subunit A
LARRRTKSKKQSLLDLSGSDGNGTSARQNSGSNNESTVALHEAAQTRYLNYALSVITSRALPDVRDGLKPVQRRILYSMWRQHLTVDAKHRKCAKVVGDVMGSYHPHGDQALYDALVRMAQPFSFRYPLIEGSGNFGSLDGDRAAAMRYTECRLARTANEILREIDQGTVDFRANYDGTHQEPIVLPSRLPNLLINGATGIAVGMATSIPPHNIGEVCTALLKLLDKPELSSKRLCQWIKGPDFPTGGQILNSAEDLKDIYEEGSGVIRLRAQWEAGPSTRGGKLVYITSVPYMVNKAQLIERIADVVLSRKLPPLLDVKDLSTDEVRIALELKKDADEKMVLAYLFKHTPLQTSITVNLTCLLPTDPSDPAMRPQRVDLKRILYEFIRFRENVVTRRLKHELSVLKRRTHILEGFEKVFDALDAIIKLIRGSDGKADAAKKVMKKFALDAEQTDAILELKIYRLARLEILQIREELTDKKRQARKIGRLLKDEESLRELVRDEIAEVQKQYGGAKTDTRLTLIEPAEDNVEFSAEDFIVEEDNVVIVSRDGWVKRQKEVRDLSTTRLREGDSVLSVVAGSTRATVAFFTNFGTAYTCRIIDVPASTGYGEPIQSLFKLKDGEHVVAAISLDPRFASNINAATEEDIPPTHGIAVTSNGYSLRFGFQSFVEPSTRSGRRFARPSAGATVVGVAATTSNETVIVVTEKAHALLCAADEISFLSGPGKGVILIKIKRDDDRVLGFVTSTGDRDLLRVKTNQGGTHTISTGKYQLTGRGGKGRKLLQRGQFTEIVPTQPELPTPDRDN